MKGTYKNSEYFGKIIRYSDDKSCFMRENSFELNDGDTVEGYIDNHRMFIVERKL
ncbi:hypothetical protein [Paenibacillus jamilae]|uniref:hypothetical protein n=1 Tax=Paenibacillus jamilae TaxID=114136 RepID=UPI000AD1F490|nr:hypothetical protein [Paenibacillus jamilae]